MILLADTHILLWTLAGTLPALAVPYIKDADNTVLFSPVSAWEVVIKQALKRPNFQVDPAVFYNELLKIGCTELPVESRHVLAVGGLPPIHKDPFDRLLLAQAHSEGVPLLTADETIAKYGGDIIYTP